MREMMEFNVNYFASQAKMINNYRIGFVERTFRLLFSILYSFDIRHDVSVVFTHSAYIFISL